MFQTNAPVGITFSDSFSFSLLGPTVRKQLFETAEPALVSGECLILPLSEDVTLDSVVTATLVDQVDTAEWEEVQEVSVLSVDLEPNDNIVTEEELNEENSVIANEDGTAGTGITNRPKRKRNNVVSDEPLTKKRKVKPSKWIASKAKEAYNSGVAHKSLRGVNKPARTMKPGCDSKCRKQCHSFISEETRQVLFAKYWSLKDKMLQWYFLSKLTSTLGISKRKVLAEEDDNYYRNNTYHYYLPDCNNNRFQVCQKMFVDTFDVSVRVVRTAISKSSPDKRGKHPHHKKLDSALVDSVKSHIKSFPMVESHYCRADSNRKYLDEHLNVSKMHRLYLMGKDPKDKEVASLRQYRDIFNSYFNLSFFKPKKDQCSQCAEWQSSEENAAKYQLHQDSKNFVRGLKKQDKERSRDKEQGTNVRVLTCDLEKVLYCPQSELGDFYYKRKLSVYNFTIFDCTVKEGHLYVWDMTTGKRGSDETSSFLQHYIENVVSKNEAIDTIIIYSDSCSGQNKNQFLYTMFYSLAMRLKLTIIHRYLEKGHTQMECDSVHARVEKKIKKQEIFTPSQYYGFMRTAKVKKPIYKVHEVKQNEIFNYRTLAKHMNWSKVPISKVREIIFGPTAPGVVKYKVEWTGPQIEKQILVRHVGRNVRWETVKPAKSYNVKIPLKPKLVKDLQWYVKKGHIPEQYVPLYNKWTEPPAQPLENNEDDEDDDVPTEIVPNTQVVQDLMVTEYEDVQLENANPFLIFNHEADDNVDEDLRSVYNDSDGSDSD